MPNFIALDESLLFSKDDSKDPRLGDLVSNQSSEASDLVVRGYPDDEGIRLNGGRLGAALAPKEIRHWLYRMTPHPRRALKSFFDEGDLQLTSTLDERHEIARTTAESHLARKRQLLSFGGGNDFAFPDGLAFLKTYAEQKPLVINIDAHLDVRDLTRGPNSGTPFYRLLESGIDFEFIEFGIQGQCNSTAHWDYVEQKGGKIISLDELMDSGLSLTATAVDLMGLSLQKRRPAFVAIDIDAFAWPYAMGSSASWPIGLDPLAFWPFYQLLLRRLDVRVVGIYEVSPPLDLGMGTAKLAAQFAHGFLHHV